MCSVILNEVKNLINSGKYKCEILRLTPQNDVIGQTLNPPLEKEDEEKVLPFFKGEPERILKQKKPLTYLSGDSARFIFTFYEILFPQNHLLNLCFLF